MTDRFATAIIIGEWSPTATIKVLHSPGRVVTTWRNSEEDTTAETWMTRLNDSMDRAEAKLGEIPRAQVVMFVPQVTPKEYRLLKKLYSGQARMCDACDDIIRNWTMIEKDPYCLKCAQELFS